MLRTDVPVALPSTSRHRATWQEVGVATAGTALAYLVGHDGSPLWQAGRVGIVAALTAGAVAGVRRRSTLARSAVLLVGGLVVAAAGAGIGGPHLAKTGWSALTAAGLVSLAAGLALSTAGAVRIVRATPRWWRLVVVPAVLLVAYAVVAPVTLAVGATNVPRTDVGAATPADRGLDYRDMELDTVDGVTLSGWYVPSEGGAAVALLHGAGSTRSSVLDHAVVLARHGYGVLLLDARGHGRSEGRAMDLGWHGDEDVGAAVSFLRRQADVDPARIAAVGLSMGGEEAIGAAASDDRIRAVVAEGATNRVPADRHWLSDEYGLRGWLQEGVDWLTYNLADVLTDAGKPTALRAAVASSQRPTLLIAAGDVEGEAAAGRSIRAGAPAAVELWVVPGTGHTDALRTHPDEWEARVVAFLDEALAP